MPTFKRKVPLGPPIRWSEQPGDMLLEIATPVPEKGDILAAQANLTPQIKPGLEAGLVDVESELTDG